jgi:transcriptional regulator with XRE-family HTH domain
MSETTAELGAKIRRLRMRMSLTQAQFARKVGVSQQKLSDWENGKRLRSVMEAMRLARVLKGKK